MLTISSSGPQKTAAAKEYIAPAEKPTLSSRADSVLIFKLGH